MHSPLVPPVDSLEIRHRADSLAALNPVREARAAIARGDLRYLAVCRIECTAIGIHPDSICLLGQCESERRSAVLTIEGTEGFESMPDVLRLDSIVTAYGIRYNAEVHAYRQRIAPRVLIIS